MTTCVTADFADMFHWRVDTYLSRDEAKMSDVKRSLKVEGYMVRTHYYPSLGAYGLRAIKYKKGEPDLGVKQMMIGWVRF